MSKYFREIAKSQKKIKINKKTIVMKYYIFFLQNEKLKTLLNEVPNYFVREIKDTLNKNPTILS